MQPTLLAVPLALLLAVFPGAAQLLSRVKASTVYVGSFGTTPEAQRLRHDLIAELGRNHDLKLVEAAEAADVLLTGAGDVWVKGYYSTNPRVRYLNSDARPINGGYLSVELKDKRLETVWSYLATPRRFGSEDIGLNLAAQVVNQLKNVIAPPAKP